MEDRDKTKDRLIHELAELRQKVAELETGKAGLLNTEKSFYKREQLLKSILAASPVGIVQTQDRKIKWANRAWEEMFGFRHEQEYLHQPTAIMHLYDTEYEHVRSMLYDNLQAEGVSETDGVLRRKDGSTFDAHIRISPLDPDDPAGGAISAITDISARKAAEQLLETEKRRFQILCENAPFAMVIVQSDGSFTYANPKFSEIFGYDLNDVPTGKDWLRKAYPNAQYRHEAIAAWLEDMQTHTYGETRPRVFVVTCKDGTEKTILFRPVKLDSVEDLMTCEDITARKKSREALEESRESYRNLLNQAKAQEELYRSLLNCSPDPIVVYDMEGRVKYLNPAHTNLFGWTLEDALGKRLDTLPDWDRDLSISIIKQIVQEGAISQSHETQRRTKDGRFIDVSVNGARYLDHEGNPAGMVVVLHDISNRKRIEESLRESEARYRQLSEVTFEAILFHDQGVLLEANDQFFEMFGYERHELIGKPILEKTVGSESLEMVRARIAAGSTETYEATELRKDGTTFAAEIRVRPIISQGRTIRAVAIRDISQRKNLEQQLLQAQKMEAVGTLAGGIAHDFNNLLQAVLGYTEILMRRQKPDSPDVEDLRKISAAGKRGADLVRNLLTFSRKVEPRLQVLDLNHEVREVQRLLSRTIPKTVKIVLQSRGYVNEIMADSSQVAQILMNLAVNARDAMPDGGTLTIETENIVLGETVSSIHPEVKPGLYVLLTVSDTGHGMDKQTVERMFDPFFTTKEVGKGTGLGLATVYGIVKGHNGHITCSSEPGLGTVFKIYFPAIERKEQAETVVQEAEPPRGTETILLVEDEEPLRDLGKDILASFGYRVIEASDGKQALNIYREQGEKISLVMLDLNMPEMDGEHCMTEILKMNPMARVLVVTGFPEHVIKGSVVERKAAGVVSKPYDVRRLLKEVRDVLDADQ
jgi:PAS domain S-box-containing protein